MLVPQSEFLEHEQTPAVKLPLQHRDAAVADWPIGVQAPHDPLARHTLGLVQLEFVVHLQIPSVRVPPVQHWLVELAADPSAMHVPHVPELRHTLGLTQLEFVVHLQMPLVSVPPVQHWLVELAADPSGMQAPHPPIARHTDGLVQLLLVVQDVVHVPERHILPVPQSVFVEHAPQ